MLYSGRKQKFFVIICIIIAFSLFSCSDKNHITDPATVDGNNEVSGNTETDPIEEEDDNNTQVDEINEEVCESEISEIEITPDDEPEFDFRNVRWGMDQASVAATESMPIIEKCPEWLIYSDLQWVFDYKAAEVKYCFNKYDELYCIEVVFDDEWMHKFGIYYLTTSIQVLNEKIAEAYGANTPGQPKKRWSEYDEVQFPTAEKKEWLQSRGYNFNHYTLWETERSEIYTASIIYSFYDNDAIVVFKSRIISQFPDKKTYDTQEETALPVEDWTPEIPESAEVIDSRVVPISDTEPSLAGVQPKDYYTKGPVNIRKNPSISAGVLDSLHPSNESKWFLWEERFAENNETTISMYGVKSDGYMWIPIVRYDDSRLKIEKSGWVALEVVELQR